MVVAPVAGALAADRQVLADLVRAEQRREDQAIEVGFGDHAAAQAASDASRHTDHPRLQSHFGAGIMHVIDDEPGRLAEVDGLGPKRTAMIAAAWAEQKATGRQHMVQLGLLAADDGCGTGLTILWSPAEEMRTAILEIATRTNVRSGPAPG
jgi:hypothetical protein